MKKFNNVIALVVLSVIFVACGTQKPKKLTAEYVREQEQQLLLSKRLKDLENAAKKEDKEFDLKIQKYKEEGWESQGANSIRWSLREHQMRKGEEGYKEYIGKANNGLTESQAISMAQANAFGDFARAFASAVESELEKTDKNNKNKNGGATVKREQSAEFKQDVYQNATTLAGPYLEQSYVFVKKINDDNWSAEVAFLYNTKQDLDVMKKIFKKLLENTKLYTKEKLWLKEAMEELKK